MSILRCIPLVTEELVFSGVGFAPYFSSSLRALACSNAPLSAPQRRCVFGDPTAGQKIWGASLENSRFFNPSRYSSAGIGRHIGKVGQRTFAALSTQNHRMANIQKRAFCSTSSNPEPHKSVSRRVLVGGSLLTAISAFFTKKDHEKATEEIKKNAVKDAMRGSTCSIADTETQFVEKINRLVERTHANHSHEPFSERLLHTAIQEGEIDVVEILLDQGVSVSALVRGFSPLYVACKNGKVEIARFLLNRGASPMQKNDLSYGGSREKWDKYWPLKDLDDEREATPMKGAVLSGNKELVCLLLTYGAFLDTTDSLGRTPLFVAVHSGQEELSLFLIERGAKLRCKDYLDTSLLNMAVRSQLLKVIQELHKREINLRERNSGDLTPLYEAAGRESVELLDFLLKNGAEEEVNVRWFGKWSPLSHAVKEGWLENVKLLVAAGADLSFTYEGLTILQLAEKKLREMEDSYQTSTISKDAEAKMEKRREIVQFLQQMSA